MLGSSLVPRPWAALSPGPCWLQLMNSSPRLGSRGCGSPGLESCWLYLPGVSWGHLCRRPDPHPELCWTWSLWELYRGLVPTRQSCLGTTALGPFFETQVTTAHSFAGYGTWCRAHWCHKYWPSKSHCPSFDVVLSPGPDTLSL